MLKSLGTLLDTLRHVAACTHKVHAATPPKWTDNLLKILSVLMF